MISYLTDMKISSAIKISRGWLMDWIGLDWEDAAIDEEGGVS